MSRENAMTETFEEVEVLNKRMLFTCLRIDPKTVPKGMYMYEVRHDDDGRGDPVEIAKSIFVNHWGTLITNRPIKLRSTALNGNPYREIDPYKDWNYLGTESTLAEYMKKHPPKEKPMDIER